MVVFCFMFCWYCIWCLYPAFVSASLYGVTEFLNISSFVDNLDEKSKTWMKKDSGLFDVAMGAFDGAEVCELAGNFLLHKLSEKYERKNLALYYNDGLAIFKNVSGPDFEKIKKHFCKLFKDHDLELTIQCNRKVVNFLDVALNLENSTYRPYLKDNNKLIYVDTESNHPPSIIKQLP